MREFQSSWGQRIDVIAVGNGHVAAGNHRVGGLHAWPLTGAAALISRTPIGFPQLHSLAFVPGGPLLASSSDSGVLVYDLSTGAETSRLRPQLGHAEVGVSANGQRLFVACRANQYSSTEARAVKRPDV